MPCRLYAFTSLLLPRVDCLVDFPVVVVDSPVVGVDSPDGVVVQHDHAESETSVC